jgi:hypothetical protein
MLSEPRKLTAPSTRQLLAVKGIGFLSADPAANGHVDAVLRSKLQAKHFLPTGCAIAILAMQYFRDASR